MSSSRSVRPWLLLLVLVPLNSLLATGVTDVRWKGNDFVMSFADSVRYMVDLAESDSANVVLRLSGVEAAAGFARREIRGPQGMGAIVTSTPGGLRVTITAPARFGYSTVWHPYSNRLVVHTFDWSKLSYGEEQYHKGLLAFEGRYNIAAEEMLKVAEQTGETRARTALGAYYLGLRKDSLAAGYLDSAVTADDHAALAELLRRRGDTVKAGREAQIAQMMMADELRNAPAEPAANEAATPAQSSRAERASNEAYYLGGGAILLILIIAAVLFFTRKKPETAAAPEGRIAPKRPTTAPDVVEPVESTPSETIEIERVPAERSEVVERSSPPIVEEHVIDIDESRATPVVAAEAPPVETSLPPARVPSVTTVEELDPADDIAATAPIVTRHAAPDVPPVESETTAEEPRISLAESDEQEHERTGGTRLPSQAAALQRKIQSVRRDAPAPSEPTAYAARRLNISRDNVELRKRMEAARKGNG
jgi:hypothetical protein